MPQSLDHHHLRLRCLAPVQVFSRLCNSSIEVEEVKVFILMMTAIFNLISVAS